MFAALGAPLSDLQCEVRRHAQRGERLAIAFVLEAENPGVELDALISIVDGENHVVELDRHSIAHFGNWVSDRRLPSGSLNHATMPAPSGVVQIPAASCCSSGMRSNLTPFFASWSTVALMSGTLHPSAVKGSGVNFSRGFSI